MGQETLNICFPLEFSHPYPGLATGFHGDFVCATLLRSNATKRIHVEYPWKPSGVHVLHGSVCR